VIVLHVQVVYYYRVLRIRKQLNGFGASRCCNFVSESTRLTCSVLNYIKKIKLFLSLCIILRIKRWVGHVARMGEESKVYKVLV
jgi:hypothetical protein